MLNNSGVFDSKRSPTALAQLLVAKNIQHGTSFGPLSTARNSITSLMVQRVETNSSIQDQKYFFNGDSMFHANKGVVGLKLDGMRNVVCDNVTIDNTKNVTPIYGLFYGDGQCQQPGDTTHIITDDEKAYKSRLGVSNPHNNLYGSLGTDCRAISLASTTRAYFFNVSISGVESLQGRAIGVDAFFETSHIAMSECAIHNIIASKDVPLVDVTTNEHPVQLNDAIGLHVGKGVVKMGIDVEFAGKVEGLTNSHDVKVD